MDADTALALLQRMKRIRRVEEAIAERYAEQQMRCPTHLSIGQEATAVAATHPLGPHDLVVGTHRAHAHYLAKGGDLKALLAELYGRVTGCSRGKGGSMHLVDRRVGFVASTAIVGGTIPLGAGLALAMQMRQQATLACVFLGDGAVEEGVFYETLNFAAVRRLPVLFVCENNRYSVYSPLAVRQPAGRRIHAMATAIGVPGHAYDGSDVTQMVALFEAVTAQVRAGAGPRLIELATYRWREHCGPNYDNHLGYRSEEEFQSWLARDPLAHFERQCLETAVVDLPGLEAMEAHIRAEIEEAFEYARASAFPPATETFLHLYQDTDGAPEIPWVDD